MFKTITAIRKKALSKIINSYSSYYNSNGYISQDCQAVEVPRNTGVFGRDKLSTRHYTSSPVLSRHGLAEWRLPKCTLLSLSELIPTCREWFCSGLVTVCFLLFAVSNLNATTYYLDAVNGNDSFSGSNEFPWKTLEKVKSQVSDGDIVMMRDGNYGQLNYTQFANNDWITYRACEGHSPTVSRVWVTSSTYTDANLIFDGLTVMSIGVEDSIRLQNISRVKLLNLNIIGNGYLLSDWQNWGVQIMPGSEDILIDNCIISGYGHSYLSGYTVGVWVRNAKNVIVTNCDISECGLGLYAEGENISFINNNIHKLTGDGIVFVDVTNLEIKYNHIHNLILYKPRLVEIPTNTVWSDDGTVLSNSGAEWNTSGDTLITRGMEVYVVSGDNALLGDGEEHGGNFAISSVSEDGKKIVLTKGISDGGTPSNVQYYIKSQSHADLIQANVPTIGDYNVTISHNQLYDCTEAYAFMHLNPAGGDKGNNFKVENNLCWNKINSVNDINSHPINFMSQKGNAVFRNNIVVGVVRISNNEANSVILTNNIICNLDVYNDLAGLLTNDYNIINVGSIKYPFELGLNSQVIGSIVPDPGSNRTIITGKWDDPDFWDIFKNPSLGDFQYISANSLGVGFGDTTNSPTDDILGLKRDNKPDVGCYEYGACPDGKYAIYFNQFSGGHINVDPAKSFYDPSDIVTLTAVADAGYQFVSYSGDINSSNSISTVQMSGHKNIFATFKDIQYPLLTNVEAKGRDRIRITFNEPIDSTIATNISNYVVNGITINNAALQADLSTIILNTSEHNKNQLYTIVVSNIKDTSGNLAPAITKEYQYTIDSNCLFNMTFDQNVRNEKNLSQIIQLIGSSSYENGVIGNSILFDGTNAVSTKVNDAINNLDFLSITFWAKNFSNTPDYKYVISQSPYISFILNENTVKTDINTSTNRSLLYSTVNNINNNNWHFYALTYNGSQVNIYVDGVIVKTGSLVGQIKNNTADMLIGKDPYGSNFVGALDEVMIFDIALTQSEILSLYNSPPPQITSAPNSTIVENNATLACSTNESASTSIAYWPVASGKSAAVSKFVTDVSELSTSHTVQLTGLQPSTEYAYSITCTDAYGNSATYEEEDYRFTTLAAVNVNQAPAAVIAPVAKQTASAKGGTASVTLDGSGSSDSDGSVASYTWSCPDQPDKTGSTAIYSLPAGDYTFSLIVEDDDGAKSSAATVTFSVVDPANQLPTANITSPANATAYTAASKNGVASVSLTGSGSDPDGNDDIASYTWTCPGQATKTGTTAAYSLPKGGYTFTLTVTDSEGETATDQVTISVSDPANQSPTANITSPSNATAYTAASKNGTASVTLTGSGSDPDGNDDIASYTWTCLGQTTKTGSTATYSLAKGGYTFTLTVTDTEGETATDQVTISVSDPPNVVPVLASPGNRTIAENSTLSFTLSANDPDGDTLTYHCDTLPADASLDLSSGIFTWKLGYGAFENGPIYNLNFTARDGEDVSNAVQVVVTVTNTNQSPVAVVGPDQEYTASTKTSAVAFELDGSGSSDPDGNETIASYLWHCTSHPEVADKTGVKANYSLKSGTYKFTLTVTDDGGLSDTSNQIVVAVKSPENRAPVFQTPGPKTVAEKAALTFTLSAADPDTGDSVEYDLSFSQTDASIDKVTGEFSWTPGYDAAENSPYTATFTASDGYGGVDTEQVVITVTETNRPPVMVNPGNKTITENSTLTFTVSGSDPDGDSLTYYCSNKPEGASFDSATGAFTWPCDYDAYEKGPTYNVSFIAYDSTVVSEPVTSVITVTNINLPPVAVPGVDQEYTAATKTGTVSFELDGSGSSDPDKNDSIVSYLWHCTSHGAVPDKTGVKVSYSLAAGTYKFTLKVTDSGGLTNTSSQVVVAIKSPENHDPVFQPVAAKTVSENASLTFTISATDPDAGDTIEYEASALPEGASFTPATRTFTWVPDYDAAAGNPHTAIFTASDGYGGVATLNVQIRAIDVNRKPVVTSSGSKSVSENSTISFDVTGSDPDGNSITFACANKPAGATFNTTTGKFSWAPDFDAYENGPNYTVMFTALDGALSSDPVSTVIAVSNINRPPVAVPGNDQEYTAATKTGTVSFELDGSGSTDPDSDDSIVYYIWDCTSHPSVENKTGVKASYSLPTGTYKFTLKVFDKGNLTDTSSQVVVAIKSPENRDPVFQPTTAKTVAENATLTFTVSATDPDVGDTVEYDISSIPDGSSFNSSTRTFTWKPDYDAAENSPYTASFTASDGYGGVATLNVAITVTDVNRKPVFDVVSTPIFKEDQEGRFTVSATDPDGEVVKYYSNNLPTGAELGQETGQFIWTPGFNAYTGSNVEVTFEARDSRGGSVTKAVSLMLQDTNRPPVFGSSSSYSCNTGNKLKFPVTVSDADSDPVTITCTSKPAGSSYDQATKTFAWTPAYGSDGNYTVVFVADDGKVSQPVQFNVNISVGSVNQSPVINPVTVKSAYNEGETVSFTVKATDPEGSVLTYSLQNAPTNATIDATTGKFSWSIGYDDAGAKNFVIVVSDGELTASQPISLTVNNINREPMLSVSGTMEFDYNDGLELSVAGSDPDGDALNFSISSLPGGAVFDIASGIISWQTTKDDVGSYSFSVHVSDGKASVSQPVTIKVTTTEPIVDNTPPVITQVPDQSVNQDQPLNFIVSVSDPDGDLVTVTASNLPVGAFFMNNTFSWNVGLAEPGSYYPVFTASDGTDQATMTVKITVVGVNHAPQVEQIADIEADLLKQISVEIVAVDPDEDSLTYKLKNYPKGMTITDNIISWTPAQSQSGQTKVVVEVSDGSLSALVSFNINVASLAEDKDPPVVNSTTPKNKTIQVALNPVVEIILADYGVGVDQSTVEIQVDGDTVYSGANLTSVSESGQMLYSTSNSYCTATGNSSRYVFRYQAADLLDYDYRATVTITAADLNGNAMAPYSFSFTTEMYSMSASIPVEQVKSGVKANYSNPDAITSSNGTIWSAWDDGGKVYVSAYSESLGRFDTARAIATNGKQINPVLAEAPNGSIYLTWQDNSAGNWDIYIARTTNGISFDNITQVTSSQEDQLSGSLAIADNGTVYLAYVSNRKSGADIYLATVSSDLSSVVETAVCSDIADQSDPQIVTCSDGNVIVAWEDERSGSPAIYFADKSNNWNNILVSQNSSEPDITLDYLQTSIHATWASNGDIYYAQIPLPLSGKTIKPVNLIDDSSGAQQFSPSITHAYINGKPKTFVAWSDSRNNSDNNDNDIYFASVSNSASTNILATGGAELTDQGVPVIGASKDGAPYVLYQDATSSGKSIQMASATVIKAQLERTLVVASDGGYVGTPAEQIDGLEDVSIMVQPNGVAADTEFTISQVSNPPGASGLTSLFSYDFGPSSTREFRKPVTITIPYPAVLDGAAVSVYWYNPQTGTYTQTGMSNIKVINIGNNLRAISFDTTHFCQYSVSTSQADAEFVPYMITDGE